MLATLTRAVLHVLTLDVGHEPKEDLGDLALQNHGGGGTSEMGFRQWVRCCSGLEGSVCEHGLESWACMFVWGRQCGLSSELSFAYLNLPYCLPEPSWHLLGISSETAQLTHYFSLPCRLLVSRITIAWLPGWPWK